MSAQFLLKKYGEFKIDSPVLHVVLGSGLSTTFNTLELSKDWTDAGTLPFGEVPEISHSTAPGHPGVFRYYKHVKTGKSICLQVGRLHGYEGLTPREVVRPLLSALQAGTKRFLLTNASGGLKREFGVGSLMMITDQVNLTGQNPLHGPNPLGENGLPLGPRFPDLSQVYDRSMRNILRPLLEGRGLKVHEGIYLGLPGPAYETPAEVALFSNWGLGAVGMSTVWEAIALKHAGATLAGVSVISNVGCGLLGEEELQHDHVEIEVRKVSSPLVTAIFKFGEHYASV